MAKQKPILIYRQRYQDFRNSESSSKNISNALNYLMRNEAIQGADGSKVLITDKLPEEFLSDEERSFENKKSKIIGYGAYREGSTGAFNSSGIISNEDIKTIRRDVENHKGILWDSVFSLPDYETAAKLDLETNADYQKLLKKVLPKYFQKNDLDADNMEWMGFYHINKDHPHCHIVLWEKNPRKNRGNFKGDFSHEFKKLIAKELNLHHNIQGDLKLSDHFEKIMRQELEELVNENNLYLEDKLIDLIDELPKNGRIQYSSENCKHLKPTVDAIINSLLKTYLEKPYKEFETIQNKIYEHEQKLYGENTPNTERKKAELFERLGNSLLQEARVIRDELFEIKKIDTFNGILEMNFADTKKDRYKKIDLACRLAKDIGKQNQDIFDYLNLQFQLSEKEKEIVAKKLEEQNTKKINSNELEEFLKLLEDNKKLFISIKSVRLDKKSILEKYFANNKNYRQKSLNRVAKSLSHSLKQVTITNKKEKEKMEEEIANQFAGYTI